MQRRVQALVLTTAVALAGALLGAAPGQAATSTPAPTSSPSPAGSPATMTTVTFRVHGCDGCTFAVQRGLQTEPPSRATPPKPSAWQGPGAKVRQGVVRLTMPTAYTQGASFTVSAPWEGNTDGITNIALGGGVPTGTTLTAKQATRRKLATACWAGTASSAVTMDVQVIGRKMPGIDGQAVYAIAWASPTVATIGPLTKTFHGLLGNQDMFFC
jgi:hypothetical protein